MMSPNLLLSFLSTVCLSSSLNRRTPSSSAPPVLSKDLASIVMHGITLGNFCWKSLEILHNIYLWNTGTWMAELESDLVEYLVILPFQLQVTFSLSVQSSKILPWARWPHFASLSNLDSWSSEVLCDGHYTPACQASQSRAPSTSQTARTSGMCYSTLCSHPAWERNFSQKIQL